MMRDRRSTLLVVAVVAVAALVIGIVAGQLITSPADAAARAEPPEPQAITASVEWRTLESQVVTRGDAAFAGAVDLDVQLAGQDTPPIVTGRVPDVGDELSDGDVALEISGRPVIVLEGQLPMYRTLRAGTTGPDVQQLEQALDRLGYDPGVIDESYTGSTAAAVRALYEDLGYAPPTADPQAQADLNAAHAGVDAAESELAMAKAALAAASQDPPASQVLMAEQAVDDAKRALADATEGADDDLIAQAEDQLELAQAQRDELLGDPDTSAEQDAVTGAQQRLSDAQADLDDATLAAGTPLPVSEVVYVEGLPRRVDSVALTRGDEVTGPVMSVSGADLLVTANVDRATAELLTEDMAVQLDLPTGESVEGRIVSIAAAEGDDATGFDVVIEPGELTVEQEDALRSANVRITIPVSSTDGDVLAVPLAAITAGPGGESRVQVQSGAEMTLVEVETGLTAGGYVEVKPGDGDLAEGDLVVVGA